MRQFIQPIPSTDPSPNTVLLSLFTDKEDTKPLAYYAPVGNKYWSDFNTTTLYGVPIYSPSTTQRTIVSTCIRNDTTKLSLMWRQDNYTNNGDIWSLSQVNVSSHELYFIKQ